jgi:hypothetical protein
VHKARENANHTFSLGKTWNLEDLSAVQSWSYYEPRNQDEERFKGWAGDIGFTVTIIKPYYWQASTAKEKEFFVASLVKIYRKYTQGKVPDLIGFPQKDIEQMLGSGVRSPSLGSPGPPPQIPPFSPGRPRGPSSGDIPRSSPTPSLPLEPPPRNRPSTSGSGQGSFFSQRAPSSQSSTPPPGGMYSSDLPPRAPNRVPSREQMRPGGRGVAPSTSMTNLGLPRDRTPDSFGSRPQTAGRSTPDRRSPSRTREEMENQDSFRGPNGLGIVNRPNGGGLNEPMPPLPRPGPPNGFGNTGRMRNGSQDSLPDTALPERRRPPMASMQSNGSQASFNTPASLRPAGGMQSASASTESLLKGRMERMPGGFIPSPAPSQDVEREGLLPAPLSPKPKTELPVAVAPLPAPVAAPQPVQPIAPPEVKEEPKSEPKEVQPPALTEAEAKRQAEEEAARPGLGRMFGGNKKSAKDMFKSAASAYGAFVPRAGGAAARMRAAANPDEKKDDDGISGVFKARGLNRTQTDDSVASVNSVEMGKDDSSIQATPTSAKAEAPPPEIPPQDTVPQVTVSSPISPQKTVEQPLPQPTVPDPAIEAAASAAAAAAQKKAKLAEEERRKKRRSATQMKYLSKLGVDSAILENKGLDFESVLDDIGWSSTSLRTKNVEALEADIRREIARVEARSWLGHTENKDDRVETVEKLFDKAIAECDELDGLLTLYSVELSSLNDDIAFIEAQSQGLQVQTANQKLLQLELQNLVKTISIGSRELEPLKRPMPSNPQGLEGIERSLLMLYRAMVTIDPTIRQNAKSLNGVTNAGLMGSSELSSMTALQEKSDQYLSECSMFLKRFTQHMDLTFGAAMLSAQDIITRQKGANGAKLSTEPYDAARSILWQYSPLMLFAKEIDRPSWDILMRLYQSRAKPIYQEEFSDNAIVWKKLAQKPTGDEQELLFTYNAEKEGESLTGTARRITVKRSQTLARGLRAASNEKEKSRSSNVGTGSMFPFETFRGALEEMANLISVEQNFVVEFFHATGTENIDFSDAVAAAPPEARRGGNIYNRKAFEPDRDIAKRVTAAMEDVFASFDKELSALIKWATETSPLQGIGIMHALNKTHSQFEDTNQDFLNRIVITQSQRLAGLWAKFVDDQVRAIEGTKVKLDKRKGVVAFIKTFPDFSTAIENQLPPANEESAEMSDVRAMIDSAYERINKAMFVTVRRMAKDIQAAGSSGAATLGAAREEIEEKNALNSHILLIENMNHYVEEVDARGDAVLEQGRKEALEEFEDRLNVYVESVVRRPLGKIMVCSFSHTPPPIL